ncbi:helix-turn-helix transcriptional regulator [Oceanobacillus polygoni]|uniref:Transcriptional regulator with XRE-family HTH domain n=1 Tax=Oceanobacillus polygoni TaxID=1235259 RepID=A0A9X1CE17_9BACI|nr:helix-turn-helix transcriptional regulator [Oceanobacillus polygoni]MBP2079631.1 transcriptional regulator with XRE-family HTH domain [Oceanobacillus polygoni]
MKKREWLFDKRTEKELTHAELAKLSDIKRPYYTQIELGSRSPSVKVAKRIADVIETDWRLFFEDNCSKKEQKDKYLLNK